MVKGCGNSCMKFLLFAFNFIFVVSTVAVSGRVFGERDKCRSITGSRRCFELNGRCCVTVVAIVSWRSRFYASHSRLYVGSISVIFHPLDAFCRPQLTLAARQVIGATLVSLGVYLLVKSRDFEKIVEAPDAAAVLVVAVGVVTFVIAFFGCCGASQESSCMLTTYAIIVGLVFIVEIAGAILLLVYTQQITDIARDGVSRAVQKYDPKEPKTPVNGFVDILQWSLKCCGAEGKEDYYKKGVREVPRSCCFDPLETGNGIERLGTCGNLDDANTVLAFGKGCTTALDDFLHLFTGLLAGFLIFAGAIKIIAACFACSLRNAVQ